VCSGDSKYYEYYHTTSTGVEVGLPVVKDEGKLQRGHPVVQIIEGNLG